MTQELADDIVRWRLDKKANSSVYERLTSSGSETVASSALRVGDVIVVPCNARVPADCVLLRTTERAGTCFIRTDQLDGETDWKLRRAIPAAQRLPTDHDVLRNAPEIYAGPAHKGIYDFVGTYCVGPGSVKESLDLENTLWCNTVVATGTCTCAVVYTGPHTRSALNASRPPSKMGRLELEVRSTFLGRRAARRHACRPKSILEVVVKPCRLHQLTLTKAELLQG